MAIDFPASPTLNQTFTSGNVNYVWDGTKWTAAISGGIALDQITEGNTKAEVIDTGSDGRFVVTTEGTERLRVDSSGRLLVGTSASAGAAAGCKLVVDTTGESIRLEGTGGNGVDLVYSGNTSTEDLGLLRFKGRIGGATESTGAYILGKADAAWSAGSTPGRLVFATTASGASFPTERARITAKGHLLVGKTAEESMSTAGFETRGAGGAVGMTSATVNGDWCFAVNRLSSDGDLILLRQDTVTEGSISVSGTTVSYNGAHLSRWSQLPGGAERTEILRGTVLSNIDEMCEWSEEENEQLNRMKVSDVEGDKNVAGVFQAWDDDDDTYTNDFYCAMTGDFIVRIGAGVTVERGDLLMSAGDGTAKPQDDDIIRSKTIAKVTSTNVSCTYEDGSYCVPCVLMAC